MLCVCVCLNLKGTFEALNASSHFLHEMRNKETDACMEHL